MIQRPNTKKYSRSLEELQGSPELDEVIDHDFGAAAPPEQDGMSRRRWLQLMGASIAFGSMAGCRYPHEVIAPFAFRPHGRMPGVPDKYATMLELGGIAKPLFATSYDGRPIKLDGNPNHPDSHGASDSFTQATILELYDPDRSRQPMRLHEGAFESATWDDVISTLKSKSMESGVAFLSEPSSSPTQARLKQELLTKSSGARWFEFASVAHDNALEGAVQAFGSAHRPIYQLDKAEVIVSIDCDFLNLESGSVRLSHDFAEGRDADHGKMNRLYVVESNHSTTGAMADHRVALRFGKIGAFLAAIENEIDNGAAGSVDENLPHDEKVLAAICDDLKSHRGKCVLMVGAQQPAEVHARAYRINSKLGNFDNTVAFTKVEGEFKSGVEQLKELTEAIDSGSVSTLIILGGNPVFDAPADLDFAAALDKVDTTAHLSLYRNETSRACKWHMNAAHLLESWGDGVSYDGSVLIAQPLIEPLYGGRSHLEFLAELLGHESHSHDDHGHDDEAADATASTAAPDNTAKDPHADPGHLHNLGLAMVKETHAGQFSGSRPEAEWNRAVHDGFIADSATTVSAPAVAEMSLSSDSNWNESWDSGEAEMVFRLSPSIYDGRFANNGWLQELPEFVTKLTWDNAALVNPATAERLNLTHEKIAKFKVGDLQEISLPVFILPGLPTGTICTWLGYGREAAGRVAGDADIQVETIGHDVRPLRTSGNWWSVPGVTTVPTSTSYKLATTQDHFRMDEVGREEINKRMAGTGSMIREGTLESYVKFQEKHGHDDSAHSDDGHGDAASQDDHGDSHGHGHHWPEGHHLHFENFDLTHAGWRDDPVPYKWGMAIDLNRCTGCNACVIACQAENNVPVVGKDQVLRGREMQWMRIDRYYITEEGDDDGDHVQVAHQPVTCQQCEAAPCETVCPVAATTHSDEGLNDMVYNRCIGTRYCGNNCPYKVRRFNYFNYTDAQTFLKIPGADRLKRANLSLQNLMMNPEVTVRSRGVMEKCTFCVQRIQNAKIEAKKNNEDGKVAPDGVTTACQDVCPTGAITFGDIQDPRSAVYKAHHNYRAYALLEELNVGPRNRYLARVRNPHPAFVSVEMSKGGH